MPGLDLTVNPQPFREGIEVAKGAIRSLQTTAEIAVRHMDARWNSLSRSLFSLRAALVALGIAATAREMFTLGVQIERAERSLRGVTASARDAAIQFRRLQDIGDEFQLLDDNDLADSFRLLAGFGIASEQSIRTIANVAAQTGESVSSVTNAVIRGQQLMLKRLGIQLIDLGTGEVDLVFGNIEIRAKNTEDAIRRGLLSLLQRFPDSTKELGNSMEFQFARVKDRFQDLERAIMQSGLKDFMTEVFKSIADAFGSDSDVESKGQAIANGIIAALTAVGRAGAFTLDIISNIYDMMVKVEQIIEKLKVKMPDTQTAGKMALAAPGGLILGFKGALNMAQRLGLIKEEQRELASTLATDPVGMATELARKDHDSYLEQYDKFTADLEKKIKETREKLKSQKGQKANVIPGIGDPTDRQLQAQITDFRRDTDFQISQLEAQRDRLARPELLEAYGQAIDFIRQKEKGGMVVREEFRKQIIDIFMALGMAKEATRIWGENLAIADQQTADRVRFLGETADALRDVQDAETAMGQPRGAVRREEEIRAEMIRRVERERIDINADVLKMLQEMPKAIAEQERRNETLAAQEQRRLDHMQRMGEMQDKLINLSGGVTQGQSFEARLNQAERDAIRQNVDFDAIAEGKRLSLEMDKEREVALKELNVQLDLEMQYNEDLARIAGRIRQDREAEIAFLRERNRLQQEGRKLTPKEEMDLRDKFKDLQLSKELALAGDAFNRFIDSFEVGWVQIERSAEQAWSHMEDGLVQFIQTGKLNFSNFASFIQQEMLRLSIRFLMMQGFNALGGSAGFTSFLSGLGGIFASTGGAGASGAAELGVGAFANQPIAVQQGGVIQGGQKLELPKFQHGGINYNHRFIEVSEGHTQEAIIPLKSGKVPVRMEGGGGIRINAPITIITPDAGGITRSAGQIEATVSSRLQRAAKRNT